MKHRTLGVAAAALAVVAVAACVPPHHGKDEGAVRLVKLTTAGAPLSGVGFSADGPVDRPGLLTDGSGVICIDGLPFGDYTLTETLPAGYVSAGDNPQVVTVDNRASCDPKFGPYKGESVTFLNEAVALTDLTVTADSQTGNTNSVIDCDGTVSNSDPVTGDNTLTLPDLPPGTYDCEIVITADP